jgi:hypothetical protein
MQGQQATLNGFACGRSTDVNGIAIDSCGNLLVTFPAQAGLPTDATYVSQQTAGTRLRSGVCARAAVPPTVIKPVAQPPAAPPSTVGNGSNRLAATGAPAGVAALGLLLLAAGLLLFRRTAIRP